MSTVEHIKLDEGWEIVLDCRRVVAVPSTQHSDSDYKFTGVIDNDRLVDFYLGGSAVRRQCERLGVTPEDLAGYVLLIRRKAGKRGNAKITYTDIEWAPEGSQFGLRQIEGGGQTSKAVARKTPPAKGAFVAGPPLPNETTDDLVDYQRPISASAPPSRPAPQQQPEPSGAGPAPRAKLTAEERIRKAVTYSGKLYAASFAAAREVARVNHDLQIGADELHSMAATIAIEAGKALRGDRY